MPRTGILPDQMAGSARGASCVVDAVRTAGQDDRAGAAAFQFGHGRVVREQLAVDIEFADAPRDQLGELAAEVQDDDRLAVVRVGGVGRSVLRRSIRRRGPSAPSRDRPPPPRRPGQGPDGPRSRPHRGRSCRASVRPSMTRPCPPMPPSLAAAVASVPGRPRRARAGSPSVYRGAGSRDASASRTAQAPPPGCASPRRPSRCSARARRRRRPAAPSP